MSGKHLIFILGMHRSGTSLLAKAIQVLGASLSDSLMAAAADNPKGFFEDMEVFNFNQRLLDELDIRWDIPTLLPDTNLTGAEFAKRITEAAELLKESTKQKDMLAVKDPRFCLLLPVWLEAARTAGFKTSLIVAVRNPLDVAKSLAARNDYSIDKGLSLWLSHNYLLLAYLLDSDTDPLFVEYQNLLSNPYEQLRRLGQFIASNEQDVSIDSDSVKDFVSEFLDPALCHSSSSEQQLLDRVNGLSAVATLYKCFSEFALGSWSPQAAMALKELLPVPLSLEAKFYRQQLRDFKAELAQQQNERERLSNENAGLHQAINARDEEIAQIGNAHREEVSALLQDHDRKLRALEEERDAERQSLLAAQENRIQSLLAGQETQIQTLKEGKDKQIDELKQSRDQQAAAADMLLGEARRNLATAQNMINVIQASMSYRIGRVITWPVRKLYHAVVKPFRENPGNLRLAAYSLYYVIRHPIRARHLVSWDNVRKAYTVFFRQPKIARDIVGRVGIALHGKPPHRAKSRPGELPAELEQGAIEGRRVSVFVVNYNGISHLPELLTSLCRQDYEDFEVIVVDNGSQDGSVEYIARYFPEVKLLALKENVGFAEANNIAAEVATGRYYCLVNNDAEADPAWLSALVRCIEQSPMIGAVGSKILFWKRFARIEIEVKLDNGEESEVRLDVDRLKQSARVYPKLFFGRGLEEEKAFEGGLCRVLEKSGELYFPVCADQAVARIRLYSVSSGRIKVRTSVSGIAADLRIDANEWHEFDLDFSGRLADDGLTWLINNAGSEASENGEVRDRGYAVPDEGLYDEVEDVTALCGGSMLIQPDALQGRPIFGGKFFAYYEDTELSLRLREAGYRLVYCPESRLFHKHASTSGENSPFFKFYVNRNRILFLALHYPEALWRNEWEHARLTLNHIRVYYQNESTDGAEAEFAASIPEVLADWDRLIPEVQEGRFLVRERYFPKIAIFNNFWNTLGGGENHACVIAHALQRLGPVSLISETDFSIEDLERQFDLDLKYCRKVIVSAPELHHNAAVTGQYDVFVNSTFSSDLVSHARYSYYVVSFPFRLSGRAPEATRFLQSYRFLANSAYTREWVKRWWSVDADVFYPAVAIPDIEFESIKKTRLILHVGRFFRVGHNKKQLELVRVFRQLIDSGSISGEWRLVLAGQVRDIDIEYFDAVHSEAEGYPIEVMDNQPVEILHRMYSDAAIYWHATGLGEATDKRPELAEHFGITTVEAMSFGCVPVVINQGGQRETVEQGVTGFRFDDEQELARQTLRVMEMFEEEHEKFKAMSARAYRYARQFSRERTQGAFVGLLESDGFRQCGAYTVL